MRIPYANGSSFASQFLYREFSERGHEVTVVGPHDPHAKPDELPQNHVCLPSLPMRNHPGLYMPMPTPQGIRTVANLDLDVGLGQAGSELIALGVLLRWRQNVPFMAVNTIHLPSVYQVLLPEALHHNDHVTGLFTERIVPAIEAHGAKVYSDMDGLIVLSRGLKRYWRERGVTSPIHVIPRAVDPSIFDRPAGADPFPEAAAPGGRLLCVCRQTREKGVSRLLQIFARHIAPAVPDATLTLVGDGPDFDTFVQEARELGVEHRVFFEGEQRLTDIPRYYRHADLFVFNSLSETYGQVISEAMWCGLPVVALDDGMGVAQQVESGVDGVLIAPGPDEDQANWRFAKEVYNLLRDHQRRARLAAEAARRVRLRADPAVCVARYLDAFADAKDHCESTGDQRRAQPWVPATTIGRWTFVHSLLVSLGLLRPPATINRNKKVHPGWDEQRQASRPRRNSQRVEKAARLIESFGREDLQNDVGALRRFTASYRLIASGP
ncbi:MAG: glycosyltransferase [Myxococcota bacterium]